MNKSPSNNVSKSTFTTTPPDHLFPEGAACNPQNTQCQNGLSCSCLALNRGLFVCMKPDLLTPPKYAIKYERQGLTCQVKRVSGATPIAPVPMLKNPLPPMMGVRSPAVDPRLEPDLKEWAVIDAKGYYTLYESITSIDGKSSVAVLAPANVDKAKFNDVGRIVNHMLNVAARSDHIIKTLSNNHIRILITHRDESKHDDDSNEKPSDQIGCCPSWIKHPEIERDFITGLGGGAPWFPSTGIEDEAINPIVEELFHTIQYTSMSPNLVCMYHKAYKHAMEKKLYITDGSGPEIEGEPVPTVQADEYMALANHRWFGTSGNTEEDGDEYSVPKCSSENKKTSRTHLLEQDPEIFCILSTLWRSDDEWNSPESSHTGEFCKNHAVGGTIEEVDLMCVPMLEKLRIGCPLEDVVFPDYLGSKVLPLGVLLGL